YLPRTWAKLEIDRLLAENSSGHKDRIVALSKAMYVMTPFTSLLVLENEAMYQQFRVDRGRKDHWAMYPCPPKIPVVHEPLARTPPANGTDSRDPAPARKGVSEVLQSILVRVPRPLIRSSRVPNSDEATPFLNALQVATGAYGMPEDLTRLLPDIAPNTLPAHSEIVGLTTGNGAGAGGSGFPAFQELAGPRFPGPGLAVGGVGLAGTAGFGGGGILGFGGGLGGFPAIGGVPGGAMAMIRPQVGAGATVGAAVRREPRLFPRGLEIPPCRPRSGEDQVCESSGRPSQRSAAVGTCPP